MADIRSSVQVTKRRLPSAGELRELVWVCTTVERPDMNVSTIKRRPGVIHVRARIRPLSGAMILDYQAVFGEAEKPTTEITIRMPLDVKVDVRHWVFHRTPLHETWYKVRTVEDMGGQQRFLMMRCSIDQVFDVRSDPATQQTPPRWDDPAAPRRVPDQI